MICSEAASPAAPITGSCARTSSRAAVAALVAAAAAAVAVAVGWGVPTTPLPPVTSLPTDPPPNPLPPGVAFPIIGPELATYGVVQPLARQLGLSILGTLDDRVGDTYEPDGCAVAPAVAPDALPTRKQGPAPAPCPLFSPSVWGRFFGQTIHNNYQAFADPNASGNLGGFQGGIDLLRGSLIAGHYERAASMALMAT